MKVSKSIHSGTFIIMKVFKSINSGTFEIIKAKNRLFQEISLGFSELSE